MQRRVGNFLDQGSEVVDCGVWPLSPHRWSFWHVYLAPDTGDVSKCSRALIVKTRDISNHNCCLLPGNFNAGLSLGPLFPPTLQVAHTSRQSTLFSLNPDTYCALFRQRNGRVYQAHSTRLAYSIFFVASLFMIAPFPIMTGILVVVVPTHGCSIWKD